MRKTPRLAGRLAILTLAALVLPAALAQQASEPEQEPQAPEAMSVAPADDAPLPPIPDPPRFLSDTVGQPGDINGDLFWWGQSLNLSGAILNNAFLGGTTVDVGGTVGSDSFLFASSSTIGGEVLQNVYAFTGQLTISEDAVIHGNVLCMCGSLNIHGTVRGQVQGSGGATVISGDVGSMNLEVGGLTVTDDARVRGDIVYRGNADANIAEGARIDGEVRFNRPAPKDDEEAESETSWMPGFWDVASTAWWYLANLSVGVALLLVGGRFTRAPVEYLRDQAAVGLGFGFVVAVVFPVACLIAAMLLVTLPLGVMALVVYFLGLFVARLVTAQFLGDWVLRRLGNDRPSEYLALAAGLVLLFVAIEIPYLGFLVWLTALFLGTGGIFLAVRGRRQSAAGGGIG
jgi:hypothetical protein